MVISNYKDLEIWKRSVELTINIYSITTHYPKTEIFGITSQMRRAVTSVAANIAEGWTRKGENSVIYFLNVANGSLSELETFLIISGRLNYLDSGQSMKIENEINEISKMIYGLKRYLKDHQSLKLKQ